MAETMPSVAELEVILARLGGAEPAIDDRVRIDLIARLEALKGAAAAAQARLTVAFDASQRRAQTAQGLPASELGRGVAAQVALARHDSPVRGSRHLGLAKALVHEMPRTLDALATGRISEWRATIMVRETATLSVDDRRAVDAELGDRLPALGDRGVEREARRIAYRLDPESVVRRARRACEERRVSLRPAPDTMSYLTGLLPVAQGVAVHAALSAHARATKAGGDPRTTGQIMADTLVERVTGQEAASAVPVEVCLVMTDRALLGTSRTPARLLGHGPLPAGLARRLVRGSDAATTQARVWVRRLFTDPTSGELVAMDSRRRTFGGELRRLLVLRDDVCRTPWCDAPIGHVDHVRRAADGGPTSAHNGQGLCVACNLSKEAPGWAATTTRAGPAPPITTATPTGHRYTSTAPSLPAEHPRPQHPRRQHPHPVCDVAMPPEEALAALLESA